MKKTLLTLVCVLMVASMAFAATSSASSSSSSSGMQFALVGSFGTDAWFAHPGLVITPNNMKNVDYDILLGYSSVGMGENVDANVDMLIGGTWWVGQSGPVSYGPTLVYLTKTTAYANLPNADKSSDNNITALNFVFSAKAPLVAGIDARADVVVYSSVSGKDTGDDIKDANRMLDTIQLGLQYNFQS
jgi:hypothetical protein